jgi:glycerol kinase
MGAAIAAGLHVGFWNSLDDVESKIKIDRTFSPQMSQVQRSVQLSRWDEAVKRSIGFAQNK